MLSLRRLVTLAVPITCAAILMCSAAALGQFHGDGVPGPPVLEGPAAPTEFVAHPGNDTVLLQWNPSIGPNLVGYKVYRSLTSGSGFEPIGSTEDEWYPDNDVDNETTYYYKVRAYDIYNREGPPTPEQEAEPLADYPTIAITDPTGGSVAGSYVVQFECSDTAGDHIGVTECVFYVDADRHSGHTAEDPRILWETFRLVNDEHALQMTVDDSDGNTGYGVPVEVDAENAISEFATSCDEVTPNGDEVDDEMIITARLTGAADWMVSVKDMSGATVWSTSDYGELVDAVWDGMDDQGEPVPDGAYEVQVEVQIIQETVSTYVGRSVLPLSMVEVLIFAGPGTQFWEDGCNHVVEGARYAGLRYRLVPPRLCTWETISNIIATAPHCCVLYFYGHGGVLNIKGYERTVILLSDGLVFSYDVPGDPHPSFGELGLSNSGKIKFAHFDACSTGQIDDMADALGMYSTANSMYLDQTYWGWHGPALDLPLYNGFIYYFWLQFRTQASSVYAAQFWAYTRHPGWYLPVLNNIANYGEPVGTMLPESWW